MIATLSVAFSALEESCLQQVFSFLSPNMLCIVAFLSASMQPFFPGQHCVLLGNELAFQHWSGPVRPKKEKKEKKNTIEYFLILIFFFFKFLITYG